MTERILAIIPALDAAGTLEPVVRETLRHVSDLLVVDDGSTDATSEVARKSGATSVVRHEVNRGKGAALKSGFRYALDHGFDAVVTLDADGQHLPQDIPKFIAAREQTKGDLIIGSRRHLFSGMLARRRGANEFSAWAISHAAGIRVEDSQSGFRLYSAKILREVPIRADGFDAESEIIIRAGRLGYDVVMIPIDLGFVNGIHTSHYRPVADTLKIAWRVAKTRLGG